MGAWFECFPAGGVSGAGGDALGCSRVCERLKAVGTWAGAGAEIHGDDPPAPQIPAAGSHLLDSAVLGVLCPLLGSSGQQGSSEEPG